MAKAKNDDDPGEDTNQGDTGEDQRDGAPDVETADANSSVVAGRDDIPVDPGNSGVAADHVFSTRVDQGGADTQTPDTQSPGGGQDQH